METLDELDAILSERPIQIMEPTPAAKPLAGRTLPPYIRQKEQPWHRQAIELAAKGYQVKEIAEMVGRTGQCVQDIVRQPGLQQDLVDKIAKETSADHRVVEIIKDNVAELTQIAVDIAKDPRMKGSERLAAIAMVLERRYGKANQPINRGTDVDLNTLSDSELMKLATSN